MKKTILTLKKYLKNLLTKKKPARRGVRKIKQIAPKKKPVKKNVAKRTTTRKTGRKRKETNLSLKKIPENPIIGPCEENAWESWQTFNPAATLIDSTVHFLYRAIGNDGISRFGYANSEDGFRVNERHGEPAYQNDNICKTYVCYSLSSGGSWGGCEDPRMTYIPEDGRIYVTYTACNGGLRVGLSSIRVTDFVNKRWNWSEQKLLSPPGEVHKNWVIFPEKINGKYAILHSISPEIAIAYRDDLAFEQNECIQSYYHPGKPSARWDSYVRGAGAPPIKTEHGWLLLYHAMNHNNMGEYKVGAMLLDLKDPTKILHRSREPVLVPTERCEMEGFKGGVVYVSGTVVKDGTLLIYYGGADSFVCVAHVNLNDFLKELMKGTKKRMKKRTLKTKK